MSIEITLSASGMGDGADETDFDLWARYVAEQIDERTGLTVSVDQFTFTGPGSWPEDKIEIAGNDGEPADAVETIKHALGALWEDFCGDVWDTMRREHDAARAA
jgi:hypothetical protein